MVITEPGPGLLSTASTEASARVAELGTILGIWAHPDDEVYLSAAIMRLAIGNSQRVACVTATTGERGTDDPVAWPPRVLGPLRSRELRSSLAVLSDGHEPIEHHWLERLDGRCSEVDPEDAAAQLGALIDQIEPDTILTFDANGTTGHADHRAVAAWVTLALETRPRIDRLDAVVARSWIGQFADTIDIGDYFDDGFPDVVDDSDIDVNLVLDDEMWSVKDRALRAHATQVSPVIAHLGADLWRAFNTIESFAPHVTDPPRSRHTKDTPR